jgi:hypothetical protein
MKQEAEKNDGDWWFGGSGEVLPRSGFVQQW